MRRDSLPGAPAAVLFLTVLAMLLPACGYDTADCTIDCEDVSVPGSLFSREYGDQSCDVCAQQFYTVRAFICGLEENPNCRCLYFCQTMWEFKY